MWHCTLRSERAGARAFAGLPVPPGRAVGSRVNVGERGITPKSAAAVEQSRCDAMHVGWRDAGDHNIGGACTQVLTVLRAADFGVVRSAPASRVDNDALLEMVADVLQQLERFEVYGVETTAAFTGELVARKVLCQVAHAAPVWVVCGLARIQPGTRPSVATARE